MVYVAMLFTLVLVATQVYSNPISSDKVGEMGLDGANFDLFLFFMNLKGQLDSSKQNSGDYGDLEHKQREQELRAKEQLEHATRVEELQELEEREHLQREKQLRDKEDLEHQEREKKRRQLEQQHFQKETLAPEPLLEVDQGSIEDANPEPSSVDTEDSIEELNPDPNVDEPSPDPFPFRGPACKGPGCNPGTSGQIPRGAWGPGGCKGPGCNPGSSEQIPSRPRGPGCKGPGCNPGTSGQIPQGARGPGCKGPGCNPGTSGQIPRRPRGPGCTGPGCKDQDPRGYKPRRRPGPHGGHYGGAYA